MKILILGGGISGLSAAWFARKRYPEAEITLLEKEKRVGGLIDSLHAEGGFFFERGPRTFQEARCPHLLSLIAEMGLTKDLIFAKSKKRYLFVDKELRSLSSFFPQLLWAMLREPFQPKGLLEDESVASFARRRLGPFLTSTLIDAMALGIYGGDIETLSMRSAFPSLFFQEKKSGRLFPELLFAKKSTRLFTLRRGLSSLISALAQKSEAQIFLETSVEALTPQGVFAGGRLFSADRMISALPGQVLGKITRLFPHFPTKNLSLAHLAYEGELLSKKGFGYLIPSKEKEPLLGMIWDSSIFPQQGPKAVTRVTAIAHEAGGAFAQEAMRRHLLVKEAPIFQATSSGAIPQFEVGYAKKVAEFEKKITEQFPSLIAVGNYWGSPSVEGCIKESLKKCNMIE